MKEEKKGTKRKGSLTVWFAVSYDDASHLTHLLFFFFSSYFFFGWHKMLFGFALRSTCAWCFSMFICKTLIYNVFFIMRSCFQRNSIKIEVKFYFQIAFLLFDSSTFKQFVLLHHYRYLKFEFVWQSWSHWNIEIRWKIRYDHGLTYLMKWLSRVFDSIKGINISML